MKNKHIFFMKRALALAKKGEGKVSPNPCVGACVVKDNKIISEGYHHFFGGEHAEVDALKKLSCDDLKGATLYVTLEPCNHHGKTPQCTEFILRSGIKEVVVGVLDKNPIVAGKGIKRLKSNGIQVTTGILEKELNDFYKPFFKFVTEKKPFVTLKVAQTLDGKNGVKKDRYLISQKLLKYVHRLRYLSDAVMVGVNTINTDNPLLNIRYYRKKPLTKVVLDYYGRIREDAAIFNSGEKVIIYTVSGGFKSLRKAGNVEIVKTSGKDGLIDINEVLKDLGKRGIANLLVEGGGNLSFNIIRERLADRLILLVAPYIRGGNDNIAFSGAGFESLQDCVKIDNYKLKRLDDELLLTKDFV